MNCTAAFALIHPAQPAAASVMALIFTAVILIPAGSLLVHLKEKMAAKITPTTPATTTAPRTRLVAERPVRHASRRCHNPESIGA